MAARWGRKAKQAGGGNGNPERISNKLDHILIAESRQSIVRKWRTRPQKQRRVIALVAAVLLIGVTVGVYAAFIRKEAAPVPKPVAQPKPYDESSGSVIFEYKPKQ